MSLIERVDDALNSIVVADLHIIKMLDEVHITPAIVVLCLMVNQVVPCSTLQDRSLQSADEALVLRIVFVLIFISTQLRKSVDNDTEDDVEQDCNYEQEEGQVVHQADEVGLLVDGSVSLRRQKLAHATTHPEPIIDCRQEAVQ